MKKYKIAVVGFGHIGRRHATIVHEYPETELTAIIDTSPEVQDHELYPKGIPFFNNIEDFLARDADHSDIVNICTPNMYHVPYAKKVLDSRKHVVIEKPMGLSKVECETVIYKALNVGKQVFVVKQNRYSPPSKWLKEMVDSGKLGDIYMVQNNCYWNRDERYYRADGWKGKADLDGGVLYTQFSHFVDIMYWIFGDITNIKTIVKDFNHQHLTEFSDSGFSQFEFTQGGLGCINFSTSVWDKNMESSLTVVGSKGSIKIGGQYMNEVVYCHVDDYELTELPPTNPPNDYGPFKGSAANHHFVIENIVNTLNGKDTITANALEGMKVVDIIERIYLAAKE
jgi:UDP-N-acetyl-2-amino-2-deoxyglucuronate dehydrogenase